MNASLTLFILSSLAVIAIPGPTTLLALSNGSAGGLRRAVFGIAGATLSDLLLIGAVALGLGALLAGSERAFATLRLFGVLYLAWLAFTLWRASPTIASPDETYTDSRIRVFSRSFLVAVGNPKGWLFFTAFLPQFVHANTALMPQYVALALIFASLDAILLVVYALAGEQAGKALQSRGLRRLNRGAAVVLGMLACLLVFERPGGH